MFNKDGCESVNCKVQNMVEEMGFLLPLIGKGLLGDGSYQTYLQVVVSVEGLVANRT